MIRFKRKINILIIIYLMANLLGIFEGQIFYLIDIVATIYMVGNILNCKYINKENLYFSILGGYLIIITLINQNLSITILYSIIKLVVFCMFTIKQLHQNYDKTIVSILSFYNILILINFLYILTGNFNENNFWLGGKNTLQMKIIPCLILNILASKRYNKKIILLKLFIIMNIATLFISGSSTGIVVAIFSVICILMKKIPIKLLALAYIIIFLFIVVLRKLSFLEYFVEEVLKKDLTFTGRTYIWDKSFELIGEKFWIGYGKGTNIISEYFQVNETHNWFLEALLNYGFLGTLIIMYIFYRCLNNLIKNKCIESNIIFIGIFLYGIIGLTESIVLKLDLWILICIALKYKSLKGCEKNIENKCSYTYL
ncbi:MAG: O-antigen ligase family protein [Sarcina sp.]